jgi:hypothetical protein
VALVEAAALAAVAAPAAASAVIARPAAKASLPAWRRLRSWLEPLLQRRKQPLQLAGPPAPSNEPGASYVTSGPSWGYVLFERQILCLFFQLLCIPDCAGRSDALDYLRDRGHLRHHSTTISEGARKDELDPANRH